MKAAHKSKLALSIIAVGSVAVTLGCRQEMPVAFESNLVHSYKYELTKDLPMDQVVSDTDWALERLFGTPDEPRIPELEGQDFSELVSLERLQQAAGPIPAEAIPTIENPNPETVASYRQHCANCHGITGNGRGPTGTALNPYPRDYRMGVFKFKSTSRGAKPMREDLAGLIRHGIGGTSMNPIPGLDEAGVQALVDYVIYLSWRGEVERQIIDGAMFDLDLQGGDRVIRPELAGLVDQEIEELSDEESEQLDAFTEQIDEAFPEELSSLVKSEHPQADEEELAELIEQREDELSAGDEQQLRDKIAKRIGTAAERELWERQQKLEQRDLFLANWGYIEDMVADVADGWLAAEDEVTEIADRGEIPVPEDRVAFEAMMAGPEAEALTASVQRGQELFLSESVGCAKCHGKSGQGDGQTEDYDDWTKDWTINVGLDPKNTDQLVPLLARGALTPHNIRPRNFAEGVFRGGSQPDQLYRRIANGIAGTPMPAAPVIEGVFEPQDIWHLINYIRSLDTSSEQMTLASTSPVKTNSE